MPFFVHNSIDEFDKMQVPFMLLWLYPFHIKLVWRLSELAFLCVCFGGRIFCFKEGKGMGDFLLLYIKNAIKYL